jgi:hypothetical protein
MLRRAGGERTFSGVSSSLGSFTISPVILYIERTISSISSYVMKPSPSISYSWNAPVQNAQHLLGTAGRSAMDAHLSFSSSRPRLVMLSAQMNSRKSIVPFLSSSKTLKT